MCRLSLDQLSEFEYRPVSSIPLNGFHVSSPAVQRLQRDTDAVKVVFFQTEIFFDTIRFRTSHSDATRRVVLANQRGASGLVNAHEKALIAHLNQGLS
jgi:hypothetical protein